MPTSEYECDHCKHCFERFQSMNDEPVKRCPKCRHKVRRLVGTGAGIIFKGSGFYQTDYRSDSYKSGEKKAKESAKASSTKDTTKKGDSTKKGDRKKKEKSKSD
jgi:putative FmdB family regulatory protein